MIEGVIVKALSGYYYVLPDVAKNVVPIQCRARGIFKKRNISPLVGDRVQFEPTENDEGFITEILPRTSELVRPPIANIDQAVLVFALIKPNLNLNLLDKFIIQSERAQLKTVICLTKSDLVKPDSVLKKVNLTLEEVKNLYSNIGYEVLVTSSVHKKGTDELLKSMTRASNVFAGQSGAGKSSLLNAINPDLNLETKEISEKLGRGKHTTRHVELIALSESGFVADTPGFSQLDFSDIEVEELDRYFIEFHSFAEQCRFRGCSHEHEPGCQVIEAVKNEGISTVRYDSYIALLHEIKEQKRRNPTW